MVSSGEHPLVKLFSSLLEMRNILSAIKIICDLYGCPEARQFKKKIIGIVLAISFRF